MNGQVVGNDKITSIKVRPRRPSPQAVMCPSERQIVTIDSNTDTELNELVTAVGTLNTIVRCWRRISIWMSPASCARTNRSFDSPDV
ncbi:MAG: hypothetical protein IPM58_02110 [Nitrospira sp.]|nr:hypothetical protein [Nitrospira sp.]